MAQPNDEAELKPLMPAEKPEELRVRSQQERRERCNLEELRRRTSEVYNGNTTNNNAKLPAKKYSDSNLCAQPAYSMAHKEFRKLSEKRNPGLPLIPLSDISNPIPIRSSRAPAEGEHSPPLTSSPVGYILRHSEGVLSQDSKRSVASESFNIVPDSDGEDIDIRIFYSDGRAVQFIVEGGKEALAAGLLQLMAEYLDIDNEIASEALSLWLVSPLLEVQLKPHHVAYEVHNKWPAFLERFTTASEEDIIVDEPLLVLKRNVQLTIHQELAWEEYDALVEVLYVDAKTEFLNGRYLVGVETAVALAALQLAIEFGPCANRTEAVELIHDHITELIPEQHLNAVRSFRLFGLSVMECKKGLEDTMIDEYQVASQKYGNAHQRRKAFLEILRKTPFYGATFFRGKTDRRGTTSLKALGRRLFSSGSSSRMDVLVGINQEYVTIIDPQRHEPLLMQHITDCTWQRSEDITDGDNQISSFFLHFPDDSSVHREQPSTSSESSSGSPTHSVHTAKANTSDQSSESAPVSRLLQISSKQSAMMEALLNALYEISVSEVGSLEDLAEHHSPGSEPIPTANRDLSENGEAVSPLSVMSNAPLSSYGSNSSIGVRRRRSTTSKSPSILTAHSPGDQSIKPFCNKLGRLCFATFDPAGRCVEAHGTLRRVLMECSS